MHLYSSIHCYFWYVHLLSGSSPLPTHLKCSLSINYVLLSLPKFHLYINTNTLHLYHNFPSICIYFLYTMMKRAFVSLVENVGLKCNKAIDISRVTFMQIRAGVLLTVIKKAICALATCLFALGKFQSSSQNLNTR